MSTAPLTYSVHGRSVAHGSAEIDVASETLQVDSGWARDPTGLPGPAELLAAAFSACLLKNLERAGQLLGFEYERAEIDVTAVRQDSPPRFVEIRYELRIATGEPERRIDLLHRNLRDFGTVYNTLAAVCDVNGTVVAAEI
ncbi:MAG: OsmC family protein [Pseudolysinimonas sp.]